MAAFFSESHHRRNARQTSFASCHQTSPRFHQQLLLPLPSSLSLSLSLLMTEKLSPSLPPSHPPTPHIPRQQMLDKSKSVSLKLSFARERECSGDSQSKSVTAGQCPGKMASQDSELGVASIETYFCLNCEERECSLWVLALYLPIPFTLSPLPTLLTRMRAQ